MNEKDLKQIEYLKSFIGKDYKDRNFKHNNMFKIIDIRFTLNQNFEIVNFGLIGINEMGITSDLIPVASVARYIHSLNN